MLEELKRLRIAFMGGNADVENSAQCMAFDLIMDASMDGRISDYEYNTLYMEIQEWGLVKSGLAIHN